MTITWLTGNAERPPSTWADGQMAVARNSSWPGLFFGKPGLSASPVYTDYYAPATTERPGSLWFQSELGKFFVRGGGDWQQLKYLSGITDDSRTMLGFPSRNTIGCPEQFTGLAGSIDTPSSGTASSVYVVAGNLTAADRNAVVLGSQTGGDDCVAIGHRNKATAYYSTSVGFGAAEGLGDTNRVTALGGGGRGTNVGWQWGTFVGPSTFSSVSGNLTILVSSSFDTYSKPVGDLVVVNGVVASQTSTQATSTGVCVGSGSMYRSEGVVIGTNLTTTSTLSKGVFIAAGGGWGTYPNVCIALGFRSTLGAGDYGSISLGSKTNMRWAANGSGAWTFNGTSFGTSGQLLVSSGTSAPPVWKTVASYSFTSLDGKAVTIENGIVTRIA